MFSLHVVRHLVHSDVLEPIRVLLRKFGIEPDMTGLLGQGVKAFPLPSPKI